MRFAVLFLLFIVFWSAECRSQIIFQSIGMTVGELSNSDCGTDQISIDVDMNGVPDLFFISMNSCTSTSTPARLIATPTLFGGELMGVVSQVESIPNGNGGLTDVTLVTALNAGVAVDNPPFSFGEFILYEEGLHHGFENSQSISYLGFSISSTDLTSTYNGWIRLAVNGHFVTIIDLALRTDPFIPVITGETLSCQSAQSIVSSTISPGVETVSWSTPGSTIEGYDVAVVLKNDIPQSSGIGVMGNNTTISGLWPGVSYDIYVQNQCGIFDSPWFGPYSFRQAHQPYESPNCLSDQELVEISLWSGADLMSWSGDIGASSGQWTNGTLTELGGVNEVDIPASEEGNPFIFCHGGTSSLMESTITSPAIDLTSLNHSTVLVFYLHDTGDADIGNFTLKVIDDTGQSEQVFDIRGSIQGTSNADWEEVMIDLSNFNGHHVNLEFTQFSRLGQFASVGIDYIRLISCQTPCPTDISGDGIVDINDFLDLNSAFGQSCTGCTQDINGDGVVEVDDFLMLNSDYGSSCN